MAKTTSGPRRRWGFIADLHLANHKQFSGEFKGGLNRRARDVVDVLRRAAVKARQEEARLVILGDVFDVARPSPALVRAVLDVVPEMPAMVFLLGNHDVHTDDGDDSLASLEYDQDSPLEQRRPLVVTKPLQLEDLTLVPFRAGRAEEWLPAAVAELTPPVDSVLCLHLGIADENTPPWLRGASDAVSIDIVKKLVAEHGFRAVVAGNWHRARSWKIPRVIGPDTGDQIEVAIPGTICPVGFGDDSRDEVLPSVGQLLLLDPKARGFRRAEIPGPRFLQVDLDGLVMLDPIPPAPEWETWPTYVRARVLPAEVRAARAAAEELVAASHGRMIAHVVVDDEEARAAVAVAGREARSAEGTADAVARYVGGVSVREPGTRAGVEKRVREYRRRAEAVT